MSGLVGQTMALFQDSDQPILQIKIGVDGHQGTSDGPESRDRDQSCPEGFSDPGSPRYGLRDAVQPVHSSCSLKSFVIMQNAR